MTMRDRLASHLYRPVALCGGVLLVAVMLLTVLDVALRHALNAPVPGAFELTELAMAGVAFLGLAQAQHRGEHITIDLLYELLPPPGRAALDHLTRAVSALLAGLVTWQLLVHLDRVRDSGETTGVLALPVWPAIGLAGAGFGLFTLALVAGLVVGSHRRGA